MTLLYVVLGIIAVLVVWFIASPHGSCSYARSARMPVPALGQDAVHRALADLESARQFQHLGPFLTPRSQYLLVSPGPALLLEPAGVVVSALAQRALEA